MEGYKVFTHKLCSPIQGGEPVWDGTLPFTTPKVDVDTSSAECAAGWNFCREAEDTLSIAGFWPDGWPARLFRVETPNGAQALERSRKCRAEQLVVVEEVDDVEPYIRSLSAHWFGEDADMMAEEQIAWFRALGRPTHDEDVVQDSLQAALEVRGLRWGLKCFDTAQAAWDAWDAWVAWDAWDARAAWAAWDAWDARAAWAAWDARDARAAWAARDARDARAAWAAWDARDARDALSVFYASHRGWIDHDPNLLATGIRNAYVNGLAIALPVAQDTLGYAMVQEDRE